MIPVSKAMEGEARAFGKGPELIEERSWLVFVEQEPDSDGMSMNGGVVRRNVPPGLSAGETLYFLVVVRFSLCALSPVLLTDCLPSLPHYCSLGSAPIKRTHSSTLAWKIPWTEEPGRLQSMRLLRVGHD